MTQGRTPPALQTLTLSSGITVGIRKVSPLTLQAVARKYPAPRPPVVENDYGDGKKVSEPNPADPAYTLALEEHKATLTSKITEALLVLGVDVQVDPAAVATLKADLAELGVDLPGSDRQVYICHIVIASEDDLRILGEAITRKTMPTEVAVQEHLDEFSGDVQGAEPDDDQPAPLRD